MLPKTRQESRRLSPPPKNPPLSRRKKFLFFCIMQLIALFLVVTCIEGYYLYGYLSFKDDYCGSFASLDDEIGWVLKASSESCIKSGKQSDGPNSFSSNVTINEDGFRAKNIAGSAPANGILAVGDSWTFGYGINWEETFAAQLTRNHGRPTALLASPAYSGAQALLLARRHTASVRPQTIVYLELGFWDRAVCSGATRPQNILKPCYWVDEGGTVPLVTPSPGYVHRMSRAGVLPGGMVGAGEKTLPYFLIARPVAKIKQFMVRLGFMSGFGNDFSAWGSEENFEKIRAAHLERLLVLAKNSGARLLLIDPGEVYQPNAISSSSKKQFIYIGHRERETSVGKPMSRLPEEEARVPGDGHYGPGTHRLIAALIHTKLQNENQVMHSPSAPRAHQTSPR